MSTAAKQGTKRQSDIKSARDRAKDEAIASARRSADLHWESAKRAAETKQAEDASRLHQQLQHLLAQAATNNSLSGIPMPSLAPLIQVLQSQMIPHQVAHQNAASQDPEDTVIPGPPVPPSQGPPSLGGDRLGQE